MSFGKIAKGALTGGLVGAAHAGGVGIGDIARHGGFGVLGMLAAKKRREATNPMGGAMRRTEAEMGGERAMKKGGKVKKHAKGGAMSAAEAVHKHERNMHKGKTPTKFGKGGTASKRADGCATKGKTKGRFV